MNEVTGKITGEDLTGRMVVIRASALKPEYKDQDRRFLCNGGYGCKPYLAGRAVFGIFQIDGEEARVDRGDIEGFAKDEKAR